MTPRSRFDSKPWRPDRLGALQWAVPLVVLSMLTAYALRHGLVEPETWAARCDAEPWGGWRCVLRSATVQTFAAQRLGTVALTLSLLATLVRWRWLAAAGLMTGGAALVLYSADLGAPAVLLAGLVLVSSATSEDTAGNVESGRTR